MSFTHTIPHVLTAVLVSLALHTPATGTTLDEAAAVATRGLRSTTSRLTRNGLQGRDNGTIGSGATQAYLIKRLRRLGSPLTGVASSDDAYRQRFTFASPVQRGANLLAMIPGSDLANEYVIVGAHYDHLDTRSDGQGTCRANGTPGGAVCNGATDNATGVAAVLAIGKAIRKLPVPPRRTVILALWDAEEDGLVGSRHYVANPLVPLAQTVAYVNFDILGATLLPSLRNVTFSVAAETGGPVLQSIVDAAIAAQELDARSFTFTFGQLRSDYASFAAGNVPTVFFSDSTGGCYHTVYDDLRIVDFAKLRQQSAVGFRVVEGLANGVAIPTFVTPQIINAVYADALSVAHVLDLGIPTDEHYLTPADRTLAQQTKAQINQIVADGPGAFDSTDVGTVLGAAANLIGALTRVPCQRF